MRHVLEHETIDQTKQLPFLLLLLLQAGTMFLQKTAIVWVGWEGKPAQAERDNWRCYIHPPVQRFCVIA